MSLLRTPRIALALALALAPALTGCALESLGPTATELGFEPGCNPIATSDACLYPYPSAFVQRDDPSSPTGVRVSLAPERLPLRDEVVPLDVEPYNVADGASPLTAILLHFGRDLDPELLPDQYEIARSLEDGSALALFDMDTGERVPFFAEMDAGPDSDERHRAALILRPVRPMEMGHRHLVIARRGLRDTAGKAIEPTPAFQVLVDGTLTGSDELEALRPRYDGIFRFAADQGVPAEDMVVAFDFMVASREHVLGPILSMRDQALEAVGTAGLPYEITDVQVDPNEHISRIVFGDFEVPTFLDDDDKIQFDADRRPIRQGANKKYPFTMLIPKKAVDGPLPLVVLGHGIFGSGRDFLTGGDGAAIQQIANQVGGVVIATDWIGLSSADLDRIGEIAESLDNIHIITDRLQQGLINALSLTRLARGALKDDAQIQVSAGPLLDLSRTYYWGASLGGIQGSSFISLSPDIARAAFGVPGSTWSAMIPRSSVFPPIKALLKPHYPDPLDFLFGISLIQARFDYSDPANVTRLMFREPLPDAPPGRTVVLQEAIGDSQVPNITTEILARAMGIKQMAPAVYDVFGLEQAQSPTTDSVLAQYRMENHDDPAPPKENLPPEADNQVHYGMNFLPNVHQQIFTLWLEGELRQFCDGACDPE